MCVNVKTTLSGNSIPVGMDGLLGLVQRGRLTTRCNRQLNVSWVLLAQEPYDLEVRLIVSVAQRSEEMFVPEAERLRNSCFSALAESFTLRLSSI